MASNPHPQFGGLGWTYGVVDNGTNQNLHNGVLPKNPAYEVNSNSALEENVKVRHLEV